MTAPRSIWWVPSDPGWWVAVLFMVGSACFALGAFPLYASAVGVTADGVTYFVGSIFFTSAALLQLLVSAGALHGGDRPFSGARWRALVRAPRRPEWWAGVVQFGGTLLFNVSTFLALQQNLTAVQANRRVWTPDVLGSIAFLAASGLAFAGVRKPWLAWRPRNLDWSIATLNMTGSIAFGVSALAAHVVTTTGDLHNAELANLGTFVGAVCFLVGALLLMPDDAQIAAEHERAVT